MLVPEKLEETVSLLRKNDPVYQKILEKIQALNEDDFRIMEALSEKDREILEQYMNLTDELDERAVQLAAAHYALNGARISVNPQTDTEKS